MVLSAYTSVDTAMAASPPQSTANVSIPGTPKMMWSFYPTYSPRPKVPEVVTYILSDTCGACDKGKSFVRDYAITSQTG